MKRIKAESKLFFKKCSFTENETRNPPITCNVKIKRLNMILFGEEMSILNPSCFFFLLKRMSDQVVDSSSD